MNRILILELVTALGFAAVQAAQKPNVLLILVDDLKPAMGCYGDNAAITPNMDALARRGMRFDMAYCNQAVCAPSRFTLMLGAHSTSTGLYGLGSHLRKAWPERRHDASVFRQTWLPHRVAWQSVPHWPWQPG